LAKFNWNIKYNVDVIGAALIRFERHLEQQGFRPSSIDSYARHVQKYLEYAGTDRPSNSKLKVYMKSLFDRHLARSTLNNSAFAITAYHEMIGKKVEIPILARNETLPYYFTEYEIVRFFSVIRNLKHLCMFQVLFCACLRASESCGLDDADLDLDKCTIRVREGKGERDGYAFLTDDCACYLKQYLLSDSLWR